MVLPYVKCSTESPDAVADKVVQETVTQANLYNEALVSAIVSGATAKEYTKDASAFDAILKEGSNLKLTINLSVYHLLVF